ncbi:MAG: polynucleotide adenylyltransferase, partial [Lachnospiraceae bacterium]|nr:polynucleotide adenylyltransferase [Lachnospiraceae bacterium]
HFHQFLEDGDALSLQQLCISGKRLIELGVPSGPPVGEMLAALLAEVVDDPARNEAEYLEQRVCRLLGKAK